ADEGPRRGGPRLRRSATAVLDARRGQEGLPEGRPREGGLPGRAAKPQGGLQPDEGPGRDGLAGAEGDHDRPHPPHAAPGQRRILYDMHVQGFRPDRGHVKCAKVSGDTMSRFHPHGSAAIYDALVRMAQPFSLRHPLIDFHGNYGSPDFGPAAERYTECRLSPLAMQMLADIDEQTVDFVPNYTNDEAEPTVLPSMSPY